MPITEVNTDPLYSKDTEDYLSKADRRITYGFRAALEMLHIPSPSFANRKTRTISAVMADYHADNPVEAVLDHQRDLETNWQAGKAARDARMNKNV